MGICSSCLGIDRRDGSSDEDEGSRLLFDDPHSTQYGTFGDQTPSVIQEDPQEVQRETETLQKIVALTSSHLVDIFAMVPQTSTRGPSDFAATHNSRLLRFQDVLAKMTTESNEMENATHGAVSPGGHGWIINGGELSDTGRDFRVVKSEDASPLVGGFAGSDDS